MENKELIKSFIEKLTLKYQKNEIVSKLIEDLNNVEEFDSVTNDNNITRCTYDNGAREILFDEQNKSIIFRSQNTVKYDKKTVTVVNEKTYIEDPNGFHIDTRKVTEEKSVYDMIDTVYDINNITIESSTLTEGKRIIEKKQINRTGRYKNGKYIFNSVFNGYNKYQQQNDRLVLLDNNNKEKNMYLLANGDALKIVNDNGVEEYYYCDSSELDKKDENKAKFNVKINHMQFLKILENADNAIEIDKEPKIKQSVK